MAEKTAPIMPTENDERFLLLQYRVFETRIERIFQYLDGENLSPILIKGWAAAQNYPSPYLRRFVDIDLMFAPEVFDRAKYVIKDLPDAPYLDLHCGARHLDEHDFKDLFNNSIQRTLGKTPVRILSAEDHLRIMCVHWLNDGGADRERLQDIYWALENRPPDFNWEHLTASQKSVRRRWIICAIGAACRFLDFRLESTPISEELDNLPGWFIKALETEWNSEVRLQPLSYVKNDRRALWQQIKKRLPPNPIQATIEMDGDLDGSWRYWYQLKSIFPRLKPYIRRK